MLDWALNLTQIAVLVKSKKSFERMFSALRSMRLQNLSRVDPCETRLNKVHLHYTPVPTTEDGDAEAQLGFDSHSAQCCVYDRDILRREPRVAELDSWHGAAARAKRKNK